jgi:hypothetical protein
MKPQILSEMLRTIKRDNPGASDKEIETLCRDKVRADTELQDAVFDYWFANSVRDYDAVQCRPHEVAVFRNTPAVRVPSPDARARRAALVSHAKATIVTNLMRFTLSDGTELRHATFGQCQREGSWLASIGKLGKANEIVGKKLTEVDLQNLKKRFAPDVVRFEEWKAA